MSEESTSRAALFVAATLTALIFLTLLACDSPAAQPAPTTPAQPCAPTPAKKDAP